MNEKKVVEQIYNKLFDGFKNDKTKNILEYFSDKDTYIRKTAYQAVGKIYIQLQKRTTKKKE